MKAVRDIAAFFW